MRKDVTNNTCETFNELAAQLCAEGFNVDHFHAVEILDCQEYVTHFNKNSLGQFVADQEGIDTNPRGWYRVVADEYHSAERENPNEYSVPAPTYYTQHNAGELCVVCGWEWLRVYHIATDEEISQSCSNINCENFWLPAATERRDGGRESSPI